MTAAPAVACIRLTKTPAVGGRDADDPRRRRARDPGRRVGGDPGTVGQRQVDAPRAHGRLDRPSDGEVWIAGSRIDRLSEDELSLLRRRQIGFVFQSFQLLANLTALENVLLPLELTGQRNARPRATELLREVGLGDRTHHYPAQLSAVS
jgi:ABC-type histidine transport system ATPase subunit